MLAEEYFATEWPLEVPRLRRLLGRNGISLDQIDDVLQEAAIRLYTAWGRVFEDRPLKPLINTIVLNAARDHHRRTHYEVRPVAEIPEVAAVDQGGAEQVAIARLELARAGRALSALSEQQRTVVLTAVSDELAGEQLGRVRAPASTRMAITRARRRLVEVLEITAAAIGIGCAAVRGATSRRGVRPAVAVGALSLTAAVLLLGGHGGSSSTIKTDRLTDASHAVSAADPGTGVAQWRYDESGVLLPELVPDGASGTSTWTWSPGSWLSADALGAQFRFGNSDYQEDCALSVAGMVHLRYHCLPVTAPSVTPAAK